MKKPSLSMKEIREVFTQRYDYEVNVQSLDNAADVLQGKFVSKDDEYKRFCRIDILKEDNNNIFRRMNNFTTRLQNEEFKKQIDDIIEVGLKDTMINIRPHSKMRVRLYCMRNTPGVMLVC